MRIKKIELIGFKSFKDRTVIQFDAGITGIVGPNGCGKSNIVDALQWVMGEQSVKHLRGSSMEDVIFSGTEGYAPSGMAEVSLVLENDGGPFPAKYMRFSELMVTRRLHRDGESEYLINKEPSRLRDIQEIFMDTGAGSKGFSIIEQGAIGKIITAKPEERRVLIEEAAGITKFKARKRESQRKLVSTDENLLRLNDIIGELKSQLESLKRQAKRAERYRELKNQVEDLDLWLMSQKYLEWKNELDQAAQVMSGIEENETSGSAELKKLEALVEASHLQKTEKEALIAEKQRVYESVRTEVMKKETEVQNLKFEIKQAKNQEEMHGSSVQKMKIKKELLENDQDLISQKLKEAQNILEEMKRECDGVERESQDVQTKLTSDKESLAQLHREVATFDQNKTEHLQEAASYATRIEECEIDISQMCNSQDSVKSQKEKCTVNRNKICKDLEREKQLHLSLMEDVSVFESNIETLKGQLQEKKTNLEKAKDELNRVSSHLYGLKNLRDNFEGFEEGVKNIMLWQREKSTSALIPMAEIIDVPKEFEIATEAVLGVKLQQLLLTNSKSQIVEAIEYLKKNKAGRSGFVFESFDGSSISCPKGVDVVLSDVLTVSDKYKSLVLQLVRHVGVVDSIETALRLRPQYKEWTFVTREGETLSSEGVLTGGAVDSVEQGVFKRRREIKELSEEQKEWKTKLSVLEGEYKKLEDKEKGVQKDLESSQKKQSEKEIAVIALKKDLERADVELNSAQDVFNKISEDLKLAQEKKEEFKEKALKNQNDIEELKTRKEECEKRINELTEHLEGQGLNLEGCRERQTTLKVKLATKEEEIKGMSNQEEMIRLSLNEIIEELEKVSEERIKTDKSLSENQVSLESGQLELENLMKRAEDIEKVYMDMKNEFEIMFQDIRDKEERLSKVRKVQNDLVSEKSEAQLKVEKLKMEETYLVDQARERYMKDLPHIAETYADREGDVEKLTKELEALKSKLQSIGSVNLTAIEEYDELVERHDFLSKQRDDLITAKDQLRKVIDRINRICSRRFKDTFTQVNERFQKVFPVLFGGGDARLILIETEGKEDGIDIIAKPPGKKLQSVTLLSGGEKALSSVALIFAIFLVKPSPFCLLDEVDAPLDDVNVMRFNNLVKEMAKRSQVIVVTHNKYTMEINEKLYGVTMQERGISKMVSVSLDSAQEMTL